MTWPPVDHGDVEDAVTALQNGAGAGLPFGNVATYGAVGDGSHDDTSAFNSAMAAHSHVFIPAGSYRLTSALTMSVNTTLRGSGKWNTTLLHDFNGDQLVLPTGATLLDFRMEGNGSTRTGRGIVVNSGTGQQTPNRVSITNWDGYCIDFVTSDAGSQFRFNAGELYRVNALTTTGRYAVHIDGTQELSAIPRSFIQVETNGTCSFDLGAACDFYLMASTVGDLNFTAECRGVNIIGCRLLNDVALTVNGHGVTIIGCDINPEITIAPDADWVSIGPNTMNRPPVVDDSGNERNLILQPPYWPV